MYKNIDQLMDNIKTKSEKRTRNKLVDTILSTGFLILITICLVFCLLCFWKMLEIGSLDIKQEYFFYQLMICPCLLILCLLNHFILLSFFDIYDNYYEIKQLFIKVGGIGWFLGASIGFISGVFNAMTFGVVSGVTLQIINTFLFGTFSSFVLVVCLIIGLDLDDMF